MEQCTVTVEFNSTEETFTCAKGSFLLDVLRDEHKSRIDTPCGGKGLCGKCKVKVSGDNIPPLTEAEEKKLSDKEKQDGVRFACVTKILDNIRVTLPEKEVHMQILELGVEFEGQPDPDIRKTYLRLPEPTLDDQRDDVTRLLDGLSGEPSRTSQDPAGRSESVADPPGVSASDSQRPEASGRTTGGWDGSTGEPDSPGYEPGKPSPYSDLTVRFQDLPAIPDLLRDNDFSVTAVYTQNEILTVEPGDTTAKSYGIAVDIGTTTVVVYLIDLLSGKKVDVVSGLNAQKTHGQDVISRINYTMQKEEGLTELRQQIINQINALIEKVSSRNKIDRSNVYGITLAGNTTMIHLAMGLPPKHIASVPFIPVSKKQWTLPAATLGIDIAENGRAYVLPAISGYVGPDIVSAVLASGIHKSVKLSLLIDIGTNGEIVLGNRDRLISCSTAAGPAFEGATLRNGVGGIAGAINTVTMGEKDIEFTTIGDEPPIGICGSGIVDAISTLLYTGIIDYTGRMVPENEISTEAGKLMAERLTIIEEKPAFVLCGDAGRCGTFGKTGAGENSPAAASAVSEHAGSGAPGENNPVTANGAASESVASVHAGEAKRSAPGSDPIVITQRDVREIQNVKASIAAGILTLIKYAGKQVEDIETVYLAGGFGNYIDHHHAVNLGLIPAPLENKIIVIGNAAGAGAVSALLSRENLAECNEIARSVEYVELSSSPEFQEDYISCMYFGDTISD